jgi:hypothetical protein
LAFIMFSTQFALLILGGKSCLMVCCTSVRRNDVAMKIKAGYKKNFIDKPEVKKIIFFAL